MKMGLCLLPKDSSQFFSDAIHKLSGKYDVESQILVQKKIELTDSSVLKAI